MCAVIFGLSWRMMTSVIVDNPISTFVVTVCLSARQTPLGQANTSAVSQIYVSVRSHNWSAKETRPIVACRSNRKSLQRWQECGPNRLHRSVQGFSGSQPVRAGKDKSADWDLCNFITLCLTKQRAGHRDIPRRHSIRSLEPGLGFQRRKEKNTVFSLNEFPFYWGHSTLRVGNSATCKMFLHSPWLKKRTNIPMLFLVDRLCPKEIASNLKQAVALSSFRCLFELRDFLCIDPF